ncbi:MAG: aminotransferase class I/II-fold pyridoxal phosphate-dependent enzyme [Gemmatimonadetes bacterium]|nr:aminotransferase class I/II-fold pyridoxal phosphate-dependent enzyme [Gemmatimonadota bacterium]
MTPFQPFELEAYQSRWERTVEMNLADSSVQCLSTHEWLDDDEQQAVLHTGLFYPEVNGTHALRERIAALYPGATPAHVLVTVGAAQANSMICQLLLEPGDEVVVLSPGYRQVWGLAKTAGCTVREIALDPDDAWRADLDDLDTLITHRTRLVAIVNPNNPTGSILTEAEMARIVAASARVGAWLHADEVYAGTEHGSAGETPTFFGRYDRVLCTNALSKAYGLAGLRLGWIVAQPDVIEALWRRHEYAVIAAAAPSMTMAEFALKPAKRAMLFARQKALTTNGWQLLRDWIAQQEGRFSVQPSHATAIGFVRSHLAVDSLTLADRIRAEASVLVAPGSLLGAEHHLRVTVGYPTDKVRKALERIGDVARKLSRD